MGNKKTPAPQSDEDQAGSSVSSKADALTIPSKITHGKIVSSALLQQPFVQPLPPHLQEKVIDAAMEIALRETEMEEAKTAAAIDRQRSEDQLKEFIELHKSELETMKAVAEIERQRLEDRLKEAAALAAMMSPKHKAETEDEDIKDRVWTRRLTIAGVCLLGGGALCFGFSVVLDAGGTTPLHTHMRALGGGLAFSGVSIFSLPRLRKVISDLLAKKK